MITPPSVWILGFRGADLPGPLADAIRAGRLAGLILFRDNLGGSVDAARALRREVVRLAPRNRPFVLVADEEGGLITQTSRLLSPSGGAWPSVPTPRALGRIGRVDETEFVGRLLGRRLRALGIGVSLAPCLDLDTEAKNPVIGSRSFGADGALVAAHGVAFAAGLARAGVGACFKHFPGHGGTSRDSHRELPRMEAGERARHEAPFRAALRAFELAGGAVEAETPWVMGAHVDWGTGIPASLDRRVLGRLARWNRRALRVTDALDMAAVAHRATVAAQALEAGNDLLLVGRDWEGGLVALEGLDGQSLARRRDQAAGRAAESLAAWDARRRSPTPAVEDSARLARLHRSALRCSEDPETLPAGPWIWILPEGLGPYASLRGWKPPRLRRRPVADVWWIGEGATTAECSALAARARSAGRPVLVATLIRGWPGAEVRRAWSHLLELPCLAAVAHLLDEGWKTLAPTLLTSGPGREALTALAEGLDRSRGAWRRDPAGWYFTVDT